MKNDQTFTAKELRGQTKTAHSTLFRYLKQLEEQGKIEIIRDEKWQGYTYRICKDDFQNMQEKQQKHFDEVLQKL